MLHLLILLSCFIIVPRFHCNDIENNTSYPNCSHRYSCATQQEEEDLFLSVQNLKFSGDEQQRKRARTSFKYKTLSDGKKHRMFVKQVVQNNGIEDEDRSSQLTCYYFDDYAKYLISNDRSRPSSGKSSIFLQGLSTKFKENKAIQVDITKTGFTKKLRKNEPRLKNAVYDRERLTISDEIIHPSPETSIENAKIAFHKSGNRKILTISRAQSPETVQVIRVDVVCNYSNSSTLSDYEDTKKQSKIDDVKITDKSLETINIKNSHYANKYLLTNTIKSLNENVSGGAKVTLLCKTFKLTDRSKIIANSKFKDEKKLKRPKEISYS